MHPFWVPKQTLSTVMWKLLRNNDCTGARTWKPRLLCITWILCTGQTHTDKKDARNGRQIDLLKRCDLNRLCWTQFQSAQSKRPRTRNKHHREHDARTSRPRTGAERKTIANIPPKGVARWISRTAQRIHPTNTLSTIEPNTAMHVQKLLTVVCRVFRSSPWNVWIDAMPGHVQIVHHTPASHLKSDCANYAT